MPLKGIGGFKFKACSNVKHFQKEDPMKIKLGASIFEMLQNRTMIFTLKGFNVELYAIVHN